jgi:hypothetical protein
VGAVFLRLIEKPFTCHNGQHLFIISQYRTDNLGDCMSEKQPSKQQTSGKIGLESMDVTLKKKSLILSSILSLI